MSTRRNKVAEVGAAWLALANSERAEVISTLRVAHRMGKGFPAALAIIRAVEIAAAEPEVKDMPESPDCYSCNPNSGGQCLDMIGENCPCPCHADHFAGTGNNATDEDPHELGRCLGNDCACTEYQDAHKTLLDRDDEILRLTAEIERKCAPAAPPTSPDAACTCDYYEDVDRTEHATSCARNR